MELNNYDPIKTLDNSRFDWKCRLRLQSLWKSVNKDTKQVWGMNMIFIDDSNWRIHAFASSKFCEPLFVKMEENAIYVVTNFKVKDFLGDETYRAVRNKRKIFFTNHTTFEKDTQIGLKIDAYAFDLFHIAELGKFVDDNRFLIDVVGKIQNIRPNLRTVNNGVEKKLMKFELYDGRCAVNVTLFDEAASEFEDQLSICRQEEIIVIMCAARISRYEGMPNLTNYPATRLYINPHHYCMKELMKFMNSSGREEMEKPVDVEVLPILSVADIKKLPEDFAEKKVRCKITITRVDEKSTWFYAKCTKCPQEVLSVNGKFVCEDCKRIIPYPDKKLCTLCSDHSGAIAVVFHDDDISRIIEKSVFDIEVDAIHDKTKDSFPQILKQFENRKYLITLNLTAQNLKEGSKVYEADEILDKVECGADFDPTKTSTTEGEDVSTVDLNNDLNDTPHTGISSTKTRSRECLEAIAFDPNNILPEQDDRNVARKKD